MPQCYRTKNPCGVGQSAFCTRNRIENRMCKRGFRPRPNGGDSRMIVLLKPRKYTSLTSLPLVSVRHYGRVSSVKGETNFASSARSIFLVQNLFCDKCIKRTYLKVSKLTSEVLLSSALNSSFCATADAKSR